MGSCRGSIVSAPQHEEVEIAGVKVRRSSFFLIFLSST
jgi:hypothetical protein